MNELHVRALLAGLFFGMWPLFMNRSGLSGNISALAFTVGVLVIVSPFALYELRSTSTDVTWMMVVVACVAGAFGLLAFNGMLAKASSQTVGSLFVMMLVVQIATPALYQVVNDGGFTTTKAVGFAAAILAAFLLA